MAGPCRTAREHQGHPGLMRQAQSGGTAGGLLAAAHGLSCSLQPVPVKLSGVERAGWEQGAVGTGKCRTAGFLSLRWVMRVKYNTKLHYSPLGKMTKIKRSEKWVCPQPALHSLDRKNHIA